MKGVEMKYDHSECPTCGHETKDFIPDGKCPCGNWITAIYIP